MSDIINMKLIAALTFMVLIMVPAASFSRENSLKGGLSVGFDYDDRKYDVGRDEYERMTLSPMIEFKSLGERDTFDFRAVPGIRYDLKNSGFDWDGNVSVAADRFITKSWQLGLSDNYLKTDYQNSSTGVSTNPANPPQAGTAPPTAQPLSSNRYRTRYDLNTLNVFSKNFYKEDSSFRLGFGYDALRNDDTGIGGEEDYDRYTAGLRSEHRYSPRWKSIMDLQYVRGNFTPIVPSGAPAPAINQLSGDVDEYRLLFSLDNQSIAHNPLSLSYKYIDTVYDEPAWHDISIHQVRLTWRRDFSPHLYTRLGAGPSYEKTEGRDAKWNENGIAEVNYTMEHGFVNFLVEKTYDVDNFSGSNDAALVDAWNATLSANYQLRKDLNLSGFLAYIYEDREDPVTFQDNPAAGQLGSYNDTRYVAGTVLKYNFWQFYSAGLGYTYTKQDSERVGDTYDDHRILLTLSWEKELFRW